MVVVVKDGQILTNRSFGHAKLGTDNNTPVAVNPDTLFRWASISKVPTAIAAMQLVEKGKLDLDTDIATSLDFTIEKKHDQPITLRHLLTHTAGFEGNSTRLNPRLLDSPLAEFVRHNPPVSVYRPGTIPTYSNYGIALAGHPTPTTASPWPDTSSRRPAASPSTST